MISPQEIYLLYKPRFYFGICPRRKPLDIEKCTPHETHWKSSSFIKYSLIVNTWYMLDKLLHDINCIIYKNCRHLSFSVWCRNAVIRLSFFLHKMVAETKSQDDKLLLYWKYFSTSRIIQSDSELLQIHWWLLKSW